MTNTELAGSIRHYFLTLAALVRDLTTLQERNNRAFSRVGKLSDAEGEVFIIKPGARKFLDAAGATKSATYYWSPQHPDMFFESSAGNPDFDSADVNHIVISDDIAAGFLKYLEADLRRCAELFYDDALVRDRADRVNTVASKFLDFTDNGDFPKLPNSTERKPSTMELVKYALDSIQRSTRGAGIY